MTKTMSRLLGVLLTIPALFVTVLPEARGTNFTFTTINAPGATEFTSLTGINDSGQIVGISSSAAAATFLDSGGMFTAITVPGATSTEAVGINNLGQIVGDFASGGPIQGFLDSGGVFTTIDVPGALGSYPFGINNEGQIVGSFGSGGSSYGFLDSGGAFTTIDRGPGTTADGINDGGQIVGYPGFLDSGGVFTTIDVPGASYTSAFGINDSGQIVGSFGRGGSIYGFLDSGGVFTTINVPGATSTYAYGINNLGQIVGSFTDCFGTGGPCTGSGFVATPVATPEPGTLFLIGTGVFALGARRRKSQANKGVDHD